MSSPAPFRRARARLATLTARTRIVVAAAALGGCGGDSTGPGDDGDDGGSFTGTPNPLNVTATPDLSRSATAVVGAQGATLTATGADGSRFTLSIPAGAVAVGTPVVMSPVTAISGLPLSNGLVAAVLLQPDGLHFFEPVTLTIEPARSVPVAEQLGFAAQGGGADFHLHPLAPTAAIALQLTHFTTVGVGAGTAADRTALESRTPQSPSAQLEQQVEAIVGPERARQLAGQPADPTVGSRLQELMVTYLEQVVEPKLRAADANPGNLALLLDAFTTAMAWERQALLLSVDRSIVNRLVPIVGELAPLLYEAGFTNCMSANLDTQIAAQAQVMLYATRTAEFFGVHDAARMPAEQLVQCLGRRLPLALELSVVSQAAAETYGDPEGTHRYDMEVSSATIQLTRTENTLTYSGNAPIDYQSFTVTSTHQCDTQTAGGTTNGVWTVRLNVAEDRSLRINGAISTAPTESWTHAITGPPATCGEADPVTLTQSLWANGWSLAAALLSNGGLDFPSGLSLAPGAPVLASTVEAPGISGYPVGPFLYTRVQAAFELRVTAP
jgi:hypothetical protein